MLQIMMILRHDFFHSNDSDARRAHADASCQCHCLTVGGEPRRLTPASQASALTVEHPRPVAPAAAADLDADCNCDSGYTSTMTVVLCNQA